MLWEGTAVAHNDIPYAGSTISSIYPIYAVKGKEKMLISVTAALNAKENEYTAVRDQISNIYGVPQIDQGNLALWSDPHSETDGTVLCLRPFEGRLYVIFCDAEVEALLNSLI